MSSRAGVLFLMAASLASAAIAQPDLSVTGSCPGTVTITLSNAPPNSEVAVVAAANTNGFVKGGVLCNGVTMEVGEPFLLPPQQIIVDANGNGTRQTTFPAGRCFAEALAFATCQSSQVVEVPPPPPDPNPDPPCFDNSSRFVDCGNGTVTDTATGLVWLFDADCFGNVDYATANEAAAHLAEGQCGLTDGSTPGDWRLPTLDEWELIVEETCPVSPMIVGNGVNGGCYTNNPWASGIQSWYYWSSTTIDTATASAMVAAMTIGQTAPGFKVPAGLGGVVWPVRGGD